MFFILNFLNIGVDAVNNGLSLLSSVLVQLFCLFFSVPKANVSKLACALFNPAKVCFTNDGHLKKTDNNFHISIRSEKIG
jgi:hypothetical protein